MNHKYCFVHTAIIMILIFNLAYAESKESFDCQNSSNDTEKTICTSEKLSQLDSRIGRAWKILLSGFYTNKKITTMIKQDQNTWIASLNQCQNNIDCIANAYKQRLFQLGFAKNSNQFAGYYEIHNIGQVSIYPFNNTDYLVAIQATDPNRAAWTCEVFGTGKADGKKLSITVDGDSDNLGFTATLTAPNTLVIAPDYSTSKVSRSYCGVGGTIAFTYHREK